MTVPDLDIPAFVPEELQRLGLVVPASALQTLARYLDLLLETNRKFNLTGIKDRDAAWRRHIIDSLTLLPVLAEVPAGARVIDVGSGGGLPGIPLAIARPDLQLTLLEATGKKARFLQDVGATLKLANLTVIHDRAETIGQQKAHRERYDRAICRAVGPMRELLEYTLPLVKVGGELLAMKGVKAEAELEEAGDALMLLGAGELEVFEAYPEGWGVEAVIVRVTKAQPTPAMYPRLPGLPRNEPL